MSADATDPKVKAFCEVTGEDAATAAERLSAAHGDIDAALALHFGANKGAPPAEAAPPPPALPPAETQTELIGSILSNARQEGGPEDSGPNASVWSGAGSGRALGGGSSSEEPPPPPAAPAEPAAAAEEPPPIDRHNAKKIRVIFWADGFTVEDVTEEEEAAAAAARADKAAPRRVGLATLGSEKSRAGPGPPMPKLPELRKYEDNKEFMEDLHKSIPPLEFREIDLSTGVPRPRPIDIMLGDMRPQPYPSELVAQENAMRQRREAAAPKQQPTMAAFSGAGHTLGGGDAGSSSSDAAAAAAAAGGDGGDGAGGGGWPERADVVVDESTATSVQVRVGGAAQRFRLNRSHTVADLKALLEAGFAKAGEKPRLYVLSAGFPPKPLADDSVTIEAAGLVGASVNHRWTSHVA